MQLLQLKVLQSFSPTGGALRDETKTASGVACSGLSDSGEEAKKKKRREKSWQGLRYCLPQLLFKAASCQFHFAWNDVTYRGKRPRPKMQYIFYNLYQGEFCLVSITTPLIRV